MSPKPPPETAGGLRGILRDASRLCPGVRDRFLIDTEGVLVEWGGEGPAPPAAEEIGVEAMAAIPALARVTAAGKLGGVVEWHLVGERGTLVVCRVPRMHLFVVLRFPAGVSLGRARFAARVLAGRLGEQLH